MLNKTVLTVVFVTMASKAALATLPCNGCHEMPPLDAAYRDPVSGGIPGSHQQHLVEGAAAGQCVVCHGNVVGYAANHRNHKIDMAPVVSGGAYSKGVFFNQTSVVTVGFCTNVTCHSDGRGGSVATPPWGVPLPGDCTGCHGGDEESAVPIASQAHDVHIAYGCVACHSDTVSGGGNREILDRLLHANGMANVVLTSGTYTQADKKCFGNYCHSPGTVLDPPGAPNISLGWGEAASADCTSCHNGDRGAALTMQSGGHPAHLGKNMACRACHNQTAGDGRTVAVKSNHASSLVDVAFAPELAAVGAKYGGQQVNRKQPGTAYGACTDIRCHSTIRGTGSDGKGSPVAFSNPAWGENLDGFMCIGCHRTTPTAHGMPTGPAADGTMEIINTGSHEKHILYSPLFSQWASDCMTCHNLREDAEATCTGCHDFEVGTVSERHGDGVVNIHFATEKTVTAGVYSGSGGYDDAYGVCANIYCHSDGRGGVPLVAPRWGVPFTDGCTGCHGGGASSEAPITSGSHTAHVVTSGHRCGFCHAETLPVSGDQTVVVKLFHVNQQKNIKFSDNLIGVGMTYDPTTKSCAGGCHFELVQWQE